MTPDSRTGCDVFITMVHGTWPRNVLRDVFLTLFYGRWPAGFVPKNLWFAAGSEFRNRLTAALSKRGLSVHISPFLWSGANSVRERDRAAHQLVEHIRAKQSDYPSSTQVIVAHSHGGNVALRALDQLGTMRDEVFIATIATPFVEILRSKISLQEARRVDLMILATTSILIPSYATYIWYTYFRTLNTYVLSIIAWLVCTLPYILMFRLSAMNTRTIDDLVGLTSTSSSARQHPLLVLRAPDDEASLALAAAAISNPLSHLLEWLAYTIWILVRLLGISLVVLTLVIATIYYMWPLVEFKAPAFMTQFLQPILGHIGEFLFNWIPTLGNWLILSFFAFLFLPGPFKSAYGRELLPIFQGCEVNSQSAPDSIGRQSEFQSETTNWGMVVTLHQAEEARGGLRHGLYNDPQCAERIAAWLQSELARRRI
jgi:hypothetical protein